MGPHFMLIDYSVIVAKGAVFCLSLYYIVKLLSVSKAWRTPWIYFICGMSVFFGSTIARFFIHEEWDHPFDRFFFVYMPLATCLLVMLAVRSLYKVLGRYLCYDHVRRDIEEIAKSKNKGKECSDEKNMP